MEPTAVFRRAVKMRDPAVAGDLFRVPELSAIFDDPAWGRLFSWHARSCSARVLGRSESHQ
jgi:hypothetical protein